MRQFACWVALILLLVGFSTSPGLTQTCDTEVCDGIDNDCDGAIDEDLGCQSTCDAPDRFGLEELLSTDAVLPSATAQMPAVVWTGSEFATVWQDARNGTVDIYLSLVNSSGSPMGTNSRLTTTSVSLTADIVAQLGGGYGLTWYDTVTGNGEIFFMELAANGTQIGGNVNVSNDGAFSAAPSIAFDPNQSQFGIAWYDERDSNREIYFATVTAGTASNPVRITDDPNRSNDPDLVWNGSEFGLAWTDDRDGTREIYFARLDGAGAVQGGEVRVTSHAGYSSSPSVVWSGTHYGIAWQDTRDGATEIYFARIDANGVKDGDDVRVTDDPGVSLSPHVVWTGVEYGIAWQDNRDGNNEIYMARLDGAAVKIGGDVRLSHNPSFGTTTSTKNPRIAWIDGEYGVTWEDNGSGTWGVEFAKVHCDCIINDDGDSATSCSDCADDLAGVFPGALEICDGWDTNCDSAGGPFPEDPDEQDLDGDRYISCDFYVDNGADLDGGRDCLDTNPAINPGQAEVCDGFDTDCSSGFPQPDDPLEVDSDGDGYLGCSAYVENGGGFIGGNDCDDEDATKFPGQTWYPNCDGDTPFGSTPVISCFPDITGDTPCDDGQPPDGGWSLFPGFDCNDEDPLATSVRFWFADCDGDSKFRAFDPSNLIRVCSEADANAISPCDDGEPPDGGWGFSQGQDCNDENPEEFDGQVWYPDCDNDGTFHNVFTLTCPEAVANGSNVCAPAYDGRPLGGWIHVEGDDCDDTDATRFPAATEICDTGIDEDCNALTADASGVCDTGTGLCTAGDVGASCGSNTDCFQCIVVTPPVTTPPEVTDLSLDGTLLNWQTASSMPAYNLYRGDLAVLRDSGLYTQDPSMVPAAASMCGLFTSPEDDPYEPPLGQVVFYLVSANDGLMEGSLGIDSAGIARTNQHPCP